MDQAEHDLLTRETLLLAAAKDSKIFFFRGKRGKEFRRRVMHFTPSWCVIPHPASLSHDAR